jgi:hypothetical protein
MLYFRDILEGVLPDDEIDPLDWLIRQLLDREYVVEDVVNVLSYIARSLMTVLSSGSNVAIEIRKTLKCYDAIDKVIPARKSGRRLFSRGCNGGSRGGSPCPSP